MQAGVTIIAGPEVDGLVTADIQEASLAEALDIVLAGTGYAVAQRDNYYLIYSPDPSSPSFSEASRNKLIKLEYVPASTALHLLSEKQREFVRADDATNSVMITAPPRILERIAAVLDEIDREEMRPAEQDGSGQSGQPYERQQYKLSNIQAKSAVAILPKQFKNYVSADLDNHLLMISAPAPLLKEIRETLDALDTPNLQVLLDTRIVILEHADLSNLGVQWDFPTAQFGLASNDSLGSNTAWGLQVGYTPDRLFTNSLMLTLNLLQQNEEASILSAPQVMAQDGHQAELKVATEEYFKITTGGVYEDIELEKIETGTLLTILPRISKEGEITLNVAAEVSNVVARGEDNLPVVTRRQARSTVRIKNGGTAAIAGLMDTRTRTSEESVPGISKLFVVGEAFKNKSSISSSQQVAVFVTARIVPNKRDDLGQSPADIERIQPVDEAMFVPQLEKSLATCPVRN